VTEIAKAKKEQVISVVQTDVVICVDCNHTMDPLESHSIEGEQEKSIIVKCGQCKHAVKLYAKKIRSVGRKRLLALLAPLVLLILAAAIQFGPNLIALALHKPSHYQVGGPTDGNYRFRAAILYSDTCSEDYSWINWQGFYSSSALSSEPVDIATFTGRPSDEGVRHKAYTHLDVRTITSSRVVVQKGQPDELPFKEPLSPPNEPIADGMKLAKNTNHFGLASNPLKIEPPPNTLVDLSSVNALILSRQSGMHSGSSDIVTLGSGDYITNQLNNNTLLGSLGEQNRPVRIFVQDERGIPGGINIDNGWIGNGTNQHPGDFQIWYNGTGPVKLGGRSLICSIIYAPHATVEIGPEVKFEGAIVCRSVHIKGGLIFFDTDLRKISDWR